MGAPLSSTIITIGGMVGHVIVTLSEIVTGLMFFQNHLFPSVTWQLPSTLMLYCLFPCVSTTVPVSSHLVGFEPVWF